MFSFSLTLKQRVLGFMTLLGLIPILAFGLTAYSMWKSKSVEQAFARASTGAINLTEINALAYAVVMESRGIYMSKTWAEAKPYADGLERQLLKMLALMARWKSDSAIESEREPIATLEKSVEEFARLRRAIVTRAQAEDLVGARAIGDNDANRKTRKAMNVLIDTLADRYKQHEQNAQAMKAELDRQNVLFLTILAAAAVVIGGIGAFSMHRTVISLFNRMRHAMVEIAAGNLNVEFAGAERKDEVGDFARAIVKFKTDARSKIRMEEQAREQAAAAEAERERTAAIEADRSAKQAEAIAVLASGLQKLAGGDLESRIEDDIAADFQRLKSDFNQTVDTLRETLRKIADNSSVIASGTQQIDTAANDLAARTEHQAATLEETAAALDEITTTVRKTSEGAARAQDMVSVTKRSADVAADVVRKAVNAVSGIEKSSHEITQIIGVIDEIAFQTNLLALNAGVEAARAGESGRGFAVVASEVRALAQRSADAAKQIKTLITASTAQVAEGVTFVGNTGASLAEIQGHVNEIANIIADIAVGARQEATSLGEVNTSVNQLDKVTQQNASMVQETNGASRSLSERTREMVDLVGSFRLGATVSARRAVAHPGAGRPRPTPTRRRVAGTSALKDQPGPADWQDF
jgi:methyl-accepting chemotaxis protein